MYLSCQDGIGNKKNDDYQNAISYRICLYACGTFCLQIKQLIPRYDRCFILFTWNNDIELS